MPVFSTSRTVGLHHHHHHVTNQAIASTVGLEAVQQCHPMTSGLCGCAVEYRLWQLRFKLTVHYGSLDVQYSMLVLRRTTARCMADAAACTGRL
jgi:hypothetical protein